MLYIIILNWNSYKDTIECLESLRKNDYQDYKIILIDNASSNESVVELKKYISSLDDSKKIQLVANPENSGFAKGCNIGIDIAKKQSDCEYIWLLNNDTIVLKNAISPLVEKLKLKKADVVTPQINYFNPNNVVWNCGGKISRLGFRKYYFAGKNEFAVPRKEFLSVSFLTNCASMFRKDFFDNYKIDERFFFGEEDFSLSLYCKKNRKKMLCVLDSKIYHKVSVSINSNSVKAENKHFVYYLNRFVDMKSVFHNALLFFLWKHFYFLYMKRLLKDKVEDLTVFLKKLSEYSEKLDCVDKKTFEKIMSKTYRSL